MSESSPPSIAGAWHSLRSIAYAGLDAGRAWRVSPIWYAHVSGASQRPFTFGERLRLKSRSADIAFRRSLRARRAPAVIIRRMGTEGLMANFLHVLEVLHRLPPGANVSVDWKLAGDELGFRYGAPGSDVWSGLFRPIRASVGADAVRANAPIDWAFWGTGKDYLCGKPLQNHREAYHRTIEQWIEISNPTVLARSRQMVSDCFAGRFCIGVHRRVGNSGVAMLQKDGRTLSLDALLMTCRKALQTHAQSDPVIVLATDDAEAVKGFKEAFGARLIVQDSVKRTLASKREVHFRDWGQLSLSDAEDVLVDTLLLSRCDLLIHASSSVSTVASLLNPTMPMIRVFDET